MSPFGDFCDLLVVGVSHSIFHRFCSNKDTGSIIHDNTILFKRISAHNVLPVGPILTCKMALLLFLCFFSCSPVFTRLIKALDHFVEFIRKIATIMVRMVHVHGFASLLVIIVLLSIYQVTGFRNSHVAKLAGSRNLQIRNDPLTYRTVEAYLPTTKYSHGHNTQLSLFGRSSPPVPTQSWVVQLKYIVSLVLYSSWQRKLIWAIHMVVLYKVGQYLCTEENVHAMRNVYHFVTGRGTELTRVMQDGQAELIRTFHVITRVLLALVVIHNHHSTIMSLSYNQNLQLICLHLTTPVLIDLVLIDC